MHSFSCKLSRVQFFYKQVTHLQVDLIQSRLWRNIQRPKYKFTISCKMTTWRPTCLIAKSHPLNSSKAFLTSWLFTVQRRTLNTCLLCMYWAALPIVLSASNLDTSKNTAPTPTTGPGDSQLCQSLQPQIPSKQKDTPSNYTIQILEWRNNPGNPHLSLLHPSTRSRAAVIRGDNALQDQSIGDGNINAIQYLEYWYFLGLVMLATDIWKKRQLFDTWK